MQEIIQLKISLTHSSPLIWRQILIHKNTSFFKLHHILQIVMGWNNYHMYEFGLEGYRIGEIIEESKDNGFGSDQVLDSVLIKLSDVISDQKDTIQYLYDFGDSWQHQIKIENFLPVTPTIQYPVCLDGQMNCPPEDCGGIGGFYHRIGILEDKKHPEHKEIRQWFNKRYDKAYFNIDKINKRLKNLDNYISDWMSGE